MKKLAILAVIFCLTLPACAQTIQADTIPKYKKFPTVPAFTLIAVPDSTKFTDKDLKKNKPLVLIMFSPDCEHCQRETKNLLASYDLFKDVQIVMATPLDYSNIKRFYTEYKIADYPNITIGKDPVWFLGNFYQVHNFPTIAVYDKDGQFVQLFEGSVAVEKIAAAFGKKVPANSK